MKMTTIQYYRVTWLLPILFPFVALLLSSLLDQIGARLPAVVGMGIGVMFSGAFMFFIPYAVLVGAYLLLLYNQPKKVYVVAIVLAPLLMAILVSLFVLVAGSGAHSVSKMSLFFARYCLSVGYFYVVLIFLLIRVLRRFHLVHNE